MSYQPGDAYRRGWGDRTAGYQANHSCFVGILHEEYMNGFNDCHQHIVENEKRTKTGSLLNGHPFYKEAHENSSQVFLSD